MLANALSLEAILQRDRFVIAVALGVVIVASWTYLLFGAGMGMSALDMTRMSQPVGMGGGTSQPMSTMQMPGNSQGQEVMGGMKMASWTPGYAILMFFMWWVMMVGMMLPSASPMLLLFARIMRKEKEKGALYVPTGVFALGYLLMWAAFSAVATGAQWGLEAVGLVSAMMVGTSAWLGAGLLIAAGIWQLTPLKQACLRHCRSPVAFLSSNWRKGYSGAFRMGLVHGVYCLGCCWFLMALLFYGGVMNLYWIAGLAFYVLLEKLLPGGARIGQLAGIGLVIWGGLLLLNA